MNDSISGDDVDTALRAVRFTLMKLESAFNAGDHDMMRVLFADSAVVVVPAKGVLDFPRAKLSLPWLLTGSMDSAPYCILSVHSVTLLSPLAAYADIVFRLRFVMGEKEAESATPYIVVLGKRTPAAEWFLLLMHHLVTNNPST